MGFNSKPFEEKHQKCSTWPFLPLSVLPRLCPCPMVTQRQLDPQLMAPLCINRLLPHLHTNLPLHQPTNPPLHPISQPLTLLRNCPLNPTNMNMVLLTNTLVPTSNLLRAKMLRVPSLVHTELTFLMDESKP